ncbi:PREDICTED: uncharacterized protein LOC106818351 [Priapulus caudatus]|uniref:Uncharacterized protein LOC106818351 n=1 Tax=Priapulus caudatus TaxID=37621 RepID=A0ABM1F283_PRICU|nr:PREDICTED: uncharacterized protein LOC106818351 [Priapulus caudatus]
MLPRIKGEVDGIIAVSRQPNDSAAIRQIKDYTRSHGQNDFSLQNSQQGTSAKSSSCVDFTPLGLYPHVEEPDTASEVVFARPKITSTQLSSVGPIEYHTCIMILDSVPYQDCIMSSGHEIQIFRTGPECW